MSDAFTNMAANLNQLVDEECSALNLDYSVEELYLVRSSSGHDVAGTMDIVVGNLLDAESQGLSAILCAQKVRAAEDLVRDLLERLKAEQSAKIASTSPASEEIWVEITCDEDSLDDLPVFKGKVADGANTCVSRKDKTVFVEIDHNSETNFFTDLSAEISRGGLFVATYDILRKGTPLKVHLSLPCGSSFPLHGSVSWVREYESCAEGASPGMGITFQQPSSELKAAVNRYMTVRPPLFFEMT